MSRSLPSLILEESCLATEFQLQIDYGQLFLRDQLSSFGVLNQSTEDLSHASVTNYQTQATSKRDQVPQDTIPLSLPLILAPKTMYLSQSLRNHLPRDQGSCCRKLNEAICQPCFALTLYSFLGFTPLSCESLFPSYFLSLRFKRDCLSLQSSDASLSHCAFSLGLSESRIRSGFQKLLCKFF